MMYGNKLAAAIKVSGKVLREFKDTVYIPFGSEYAITLKNLHTTRSIVNVYVDGDNVVPGGLVLDAGQSIDLERSIRNGNLTEGNRFKFIERTNSVEQHRGVKLEDGLIRVEFQYEKPRPVINTIDSNFFKHYPPGVRGISVSYNVGGALRGADFSNGENTRIFATSAISNYCAQNNIQSKAAAHDGSATMDWCANETGITVPGNKSTQKFQHTTVGALEEEKHSIVLRLLGETAANKAITTPVTVKHKPKCVTCGRQNKHTAKFCAECGTALEIFA